MIIIAAMTAIIVIITWAKVKVLMEIIKLSITVKIITIAIETSTKSNCIYCLPYFHSVKSMHFYSVYADINTFSGFQRNCLATLILCC